jgi:AAHS family 3-hydroxyphenylpropionic acid transporter
VNDSLAMNARVTIVLCFLGAVVEGFDIQSMGVAALTLSADLGIARDQFGLVFSASIVGLFIGAAVLGRAADFIGRKKMLIVSLLIFGGFSLATATTSTLHSLLVMRLLTGVGLGGGMPNLIALSAEASPPQRRAGFIMMMSAGLPVGGAVAGAVAVSWHWQSIFFAGGIAPILLSLVMALAMAESGEFVQLRLESAAGSPRGRKVWETLFGIKRALITTMLWTGFFFTLLVVYLLLNWLPSLMAAKGLSKSNASLASLLFNAGGAVGALALGQLLSRARRFVVLAGLYGGTALAILGLAHTSPHLTSIGIAAFAAGFFVMGAQLTLFGLAPGFYPTAARGTGVGAAVAVGRLGAIAGPLIAARLLTTGVDASSVLLALLPAVAIGGLGTLILVTRPAV